MTFKELRNELKNGPRLIMWVKSGIIEGAFIHTNGGVIIKNLITKHQYFIPSKYSELNIIVIDESKAGHVTMGSLLPKHMRNR